MDQLREELLGLLDLHRTRDADECMALWRRGIASLGRVGTLRPVPLEGLDPRALEESTRKAIDCGYVDGLDWLRSSATALFQLMISLPRGEVKRELGRRILRTLHQCDGSTFVALATCLARATPKVLAGPQARARVALCLQLPYGQLPAVDALALALISSPKLATEWLVEPSSGSLPNRQLAARLLERAAREAWRLHRQGNRIGSRIFRSEFVAKAWQRLLEDRESLTWRHVAAARGVLVDLIPEFDLEIQRDLAQGGGSGRFRQALTSLSASIAVRNQVSLLHCQEILVGEELRRAPDLANSLLYGVVSAAAFDPANAEQLLVNISRVADLDVAANIFAIRRESIEEEFASESLGNISQALKMSLHSEDEVYAAKASALLIELETEPQDRADLFGMVALAVAAYAEEGSIGASQATENAFRCAEHLMDKLQASNDATPGERRLAFLALRELDKGLLETDALSHLLLITHQRSQQGLDELRARLSAYLLAHESSIIRSHDIANLSFRLARLRSLIHLVDADGGEKTNADALRDRRAEVVALFRKRVSYDKPSRLRRMVVVTLARACDACLREEVYELSDLLLGLLPIFEDPDDLAVFAEASLIDELEVTSRAIADLSALRPENDGLGKYLECNDALLSALSWSGSPRVEGMRGALLDLSGCLQRILCAASWAELYENGANTVAQLSSAAQWLAQLTSGARRRLEIADQEAAPFIGKALRAVDMSMRDGRSLDAELDGCVALCQEELSPAFAAMVTCGLRLLQALPAQASERTIALQAAKPAELRLDSPALPAQRNIAGFHILDALGNGGAGSVFIVCRHEERNDVNTSLYALKRPAYSGQHAQVLSESEFFALFRREAGTLLSLPPHANLAGFVTFDLSAQPAPILVMEYIKGSHLGRLLESDDLDCHQAMQLLDGIAAGLEAMHALEIGHLDLKPENIVVRDRVPVLVDFGLAGRQYRPGCATVYYGAPEILGGTGRGSAMPADVYSFCCLAFEVLTGKTLFDGDSLNDFVRGHLGHDGNPPRLITFAKANPDLHPLAEALTRGLRHEPALRTSISKLRADLTSLQPTLAKYSWPLMAV